VSRVYATVIAVLIIFPVILQTVINLRMLYNGKQGDKSRSPRDTSATSNLSQNLTIMQPK